MLRTPSLLSSLTALGLTAALLGPVAPAAAQAPAPAPVDPARTACPPDRVASAGFLDVPPGGAAALAIDCVAGYGIARGARSGAYDVASPVTRGQMALFLDRLTAYALQSTGSPAQRSAEPVGFDDLGGSPPEVVAAVHRLARDGVVQGSDRDGDGRPSYRPAEAVTRGQMAAMLRRVLGSVEQLLTGRPSSGPAPTGDFYRDDDGSVFEDDIDAVTGAGIAGGFPDGRFGPTLPVTRQQMALFLSRVLEVQVSSGAVGSRYAQGGRPLDAPAAGPAVPGAPTEVARGLALPWGLAVLPGGGALVSERDSALLKRVAPDGTVSTVGRVPNVVPGGEGGLLGLALSPSFADDDLVYAYLTAASDNRVVRFPLGDLSFQQPVVTGIPKGNIHNGGRIAFGPDGELYVGTGDAGRTALSQDPRSSGGKVLRVRPDGTIPPDNPFTGSNVWSLGHRNVQGLGFDAAGRLYASELGQSAFDEVNVVVRGGNYGWPAVEGRGGDARFIDPVVTWTPAEASPSGAVVAAGSFWVAALRGQRLWQVPLDGAGGVGEPRAHFAGQFGRLRAVAQQVDGSLWVLTNETSGRVMRVPLG